MIVYLVCNQNDSDIPGFDLCSSPKIYRKRLICQKAILKHAKHALMTLSV